MPLHRLDKAKVLGLLRGIDDRISWNIVDGVRPLGIENGRIGQSKYVIDLRFNQGVAMAGNTTMEAYGVANRPATVWGANEAEAIVYPNLVDDDCRGEVSNPARTIDSFIQDVALHEILHALDCSHIPGANHEIMYTYGSPQLAEWRMNHPAVIGVQSQERVRRTLRLQGR